jgi:type I restriction enzyme S subunit
MTSWQATSFGEILSRSNEIAEIQPDESYKEITVKLWGKGVVLRGVVEGATLNGSRRFLARRGQLILSRIDARNGAIGIVPEILDGAIVSNDFPLFAFKEHRILPAYFEWLSKTQSFVELCQKASEGTTNRVRLQEDRFLNLEIRLPPLPEQRRIVARIEELATKINEARTLRQQAKKEAEVLQGSQLGAKFAALATRVPVKPLGELTSQIVDGPHVTPEYLPEGVAGIPFVTVKNMVSGKLNFADINHISQSDHVLFSKRCRVERGDVLYSKDGATRGRPCLVDTDQEFSFFVSVALIKPLREKIDGRYLVHLLNSNWIKDRMIDRSRGDMIPHIVLREIRDFPVPFPSISDQRSIVLEMDALEADVGTLKTLQGDTSVELGALLPSIFDKAFKGQL